VSEKKVTDDEMRGISNNESINLTEEAVEGKENCTRMNPLEVGES
jgi:hypothetical protein